MYESPYQTQDLDFRQTLLNRVPESLKLEVRYKLLSQCSLNKVFRCTNFSRRVKHLILEHTDVQTSHVKS